MKPRLELRRTPRGDWEWWARVNGFWPSAYIWIGMARYLSVADALHIYRRVF